MDEEALSRPKKPRLIPHAVERAQQRYRSVSSQTDLQKILRNIDRGTNCIRIRDAGGGRSEYAVRYHGRWIRVIYHDSRKKLITFLPE